MSNLVYDTIMTLIPGSRKRTASGWTGINGVCCVHNGETPDTRKRLNITMGMDGVTCIVRCFNCKFQAFWKPGDNLSRRMSNFLSWLNMPAEQIKKLEFEIWRIKERGKMDPEYKPREYAKLEFKPAPLPKNARPLMDLLAEGCEDPDFVAAAVYLAGRGDDILTGYDYYWSPIKEHGLNQRVIIPFYWKGEIVGYTARYTIPVKGARYYTEAQMHYLFNTEVVENDWEYVLVCEGPFDAIAINGVAVLGGTLSDERVRWLNQCGKKVIVVPDMEKGGGPLVDTALKEGWRVSFPRWDSGIKDAADAVKRYGKLYTIWSIIDAQTQNRLEIGVKRQRLR